MLILTPSLILDSHSDKIIFDWLSLFGFLELNLIFLPYQLFFHKKNLVFSDEYLDVRWSDEQNVQERRTVQAYKQAQYSQRQVRWVKTLRLSFRGRGGRLALITMF